MPPKVKVTKEEIIAAALEILRQKGMEAVNARAVAAALGCSTQPIFSNYSSMGALQHDVLAAGKNGAECDPQEYDRAPEGALQGTEDRAKAGDVQQLDQKQLPLGHHNVVNAIVNTNCRRFTIIRAKGFVYNFTNSIIFIHHFSN